MQKYIFDCECILVDGKQYLKEVSIINLFYPIYMHHFVMKTAFPDDNKINAFLTNFYHNIPHSLGTNSYDDVRNCIPHFSIIYVQGEEKKKLVQSIYDTCTVINVFAPSLRDMPFPHKHIKCPLGKHSDSHCTTLKVYKLYKHVITSILNRSLQ